mgnify:CR=1 FL=1
MDGMTQGLVEEWLKEFEAELADQINLATTEIGIVRLAKVIRAATGREVDQLVNELMGQ